MNKDQTNNNKPIQIAQEEYLNDLAKMMDMPQQKLELIGDFSAGDEQGGMHTDQAEMEELSKEIDSSAYNILFDYALDEIKEDENVDENE